MRNNGPEDKSWKLGSKWRCQPEGGMGTFSIVTGVKAGRIYKHGTLANLEMVYQVILL